MFLQCDHKSFPFVFLKNERQKNRPSFGECVNDNDKKRKRLETVQKRKTMSYEIVIVQPWCLGYTVQIMSTYTRVNTTFPYITPLFLYLMVFHFFFILISSHHSNKFYDVIIKF